MEGLLNELLDVQPHLAVCALLLLTGWLWGAVLRKTELSLLLLVVGLIMLGLAYYVGA